MMEMNAIPDAQPLRRYVENGDEAVFRELVVRHTDLPYSAALRQLSSPDLAADLAQSVFIDRASTPLDHCLQRKLIKTFRRPRS
jgi:DNA-directed RNA polymerase specialized sigma24 family protein